MEELLRCFGRTLSAEATERRAAEQELRAVETNAGFIGAVLTVVVVQNTAEPAVQQSAAVYLKNFVARRWTEDEAVVVAAEERADFRNRLVPAIISTPIAIRLQLTFVLQQVLQHDFPQRWPDFLPKVVQLLQSGAVDSIYAGLLCLHELARVFRWRSRDRRDGLEEIITLTFPTLLQIADGAVAETSALAGDMLRLILKIYKSVIWLELPLVLQDMSALVPWGQLLLGVVAKKPPPESMEDEPETRQGDVWWRAKKWAYFSLDRLFSRYGDPTGLSGEAAQQYSAFAQTFVNQFAPEILKCYLSIVQAWSADHDANWQSPKALYYIGNFFSACVKPKVTWNLLRDNADLLVEHFVYPQMCPSEEDLELWDEDPQEYISKRIDTYDDYTRPDVAALSFLLSCCKRKRSECFMRALKFVNGKLAAYASSSQTHADAVQKEGACRMLGSLAHLVMKDDRVAPSMEAFFTQHVIPDFASPHRFLRARACEMTNRFAEVEFRDTQNVARMYEGVVACLTETEVPVRVEAALALQPLLNHDFVHNAMVQSIPQIMKVLLQLVNEVDVDALANVMEEFVQVFSKELTPYAVELASSLRDTFLRIMQDAQTDEDFDWTSMDDRSLAALGILNTIGTLILSLDNTNQAIYQLEACVLPVVAFVLEHSLVDLYAEVFEIVDSCTWSAKAVSPVMWQVYRMLHETFLNTGIDYLEELMPALENYIAFGKDELAHQPEYQAMMFEMVKTVFENDRLGVQDRKCAAKLATFYVLTMQSAASRHAIDGYLPLLLELAATRLASPAEPKRGNYHTSLVQVIVAAVYYNPAIALAWLAERGGLETFLALWARTTTGLRKVHELNLQIACLVTLMTLPAAELPAGVQTALPQLSAAMLKVFAVLPAALARRKHAQAELGGGSNADGDGENGTWDEFAGDDEDADWDDGDEEDDYAKDENDEYLDFLNAEADRLAQAKAASSTEGAAGADEYDYSDRADGDDGGDGDDDDDDDDEDDDEAADLLIVAPLNNVDAYTLARDAFGQLHGTDPHRYNLLTAAWTQDQQQLFQQVLNVAAANTEQQQPPGSS